MLSHKEGFPFLLPSTTPLCKCTKAFFIHSFTNGHLGYLQILAIVNNAAMNIFLYCSGPGSGRIRKRGSLRTILHGYDDLAPKYVQEQVRAESRSGECQGSLEP